MQITHTQITHMQSAHTQSARMQCGGGAGRGAAQLLGSRMKLQQWRWSCSPELVRCV